MVVLTDLSGELGGMTLTPAGNPHYLIGDAWVSTGLTFIGQKGVTIKATGYFRITVNGIIQLSKVELTSDQAVPAQADWWGVDIETWDPTSDISDCTIHYAVFGLGFKTGVLG